MNPVNRVDAVGSEAGGPCEFARQGRKRRCRRHTEQALVTALRGGEDDHEPCAAIRASQDVIGEKWIDGLNHSPTLLGTRSRQSCTRFHQAAFLLRDRFATDLGRAYAGNS